MSYKAREPGAAFNEEKIEALRYYERILGIDIVALLDALNPFGHLYFKDCETGEITFIKGAHTRHLDFRDMTITINDRSLYALLELPSYGKTWANTEEDLKGWRER